MSKRSVEICETYTPGKNLGRTRTVMVERIPATEVTYEGETDTHITFDVFGRVDVLIERALRANELPHQRITYTASDPVESRGLRALTCDRADSGQRR